MSKLRSIEELPRYLERLKKAKKAALQNPDTMDGDEDHGSHPDDQGGTVLIPFRPRKDAEMETCARLADALRSLATALDDRLKLPPREAPGPESADDIAWAFSDIAATLTSGASAFEETPRYRILGTPALKAARALEELEEKWTKHVIGDV
jgi:hypothetical protein